MFKAISSPYLVPTDGTFSIADAPTTVPDPPDKKVAKERLKAARDELKELQRVLYAADKHSVLLVFQAMDAAGKDSTIRHVLTGVNPAGCQVHSFKQPSEKELDHDFLWRTSKALPERGRIGVFNRSHYEEVLVVRVHPEYLAGQKLPHGPGEPDFWEDRLHSIAEHERHLARSGTVILKFFLNVSRDEQRNRFLDRIERPDKNWKFSAADVAERKLWPKYMTAYEAALNATSHPHAPWFCIPADDKRVMRAIVAEIIRDSLKSLNLAYPVLPDKNMAKLLAAAEELRSED